MSPSAVQIRVDPFCLGFPTGRGARLLPVSVEVRVLAQTLMDLDHDSETVTTVLEDLIGEYERVQESDSIDAMAAMDADMKATTLESIKRDVQRYG